MLRVTVNSKGVQAKLKRLEQYVSKGVAKKTFEAADYAMRVAKNLAPHDKGITRNGVVSLVKINTKQQAVAVIGYKSGSRAVMRGREKNFNLPYWMNYSKSAVDGWHAYGNPEGKIVHFKSGDPRFMLIARELAFEKYKKEVELGLKNVLKR